MGEPPQIYGVFSVTKQAETGMGGTAKDFVQKTYWFVRRLADDAFEVQPLNENDVPSGLSSVINKREFTEQYCAEVEYYQTKTLPHLKSLKEKIEKGEAHFKEGNFTQAEVQFGKALLIDPLNARANLGLGSVCCETKNYAKLKKILDTLVLNTDTFKEEQRQQFNVFGISLRKHKRFEEAARIYAAAIAFDETDENLHFNIARVYYENGDKTKATEHVNRALALSPEFKEAQKFRKVLAGSA